MATHSPQPEPPGVSTRTSRASRTVSTPCALRKGVTSGRCTRRNSTAVTFTRRTLPGTPLPARARRAADLNASENWAVFPQVDAAEDAAAVVADGGLGAQVDRDLLGVAPADVDAIEEQQRVERV